MRHIASVLCWKKNLLFFSQIENELNALDSTSCTSAPLCNRPPTSFSKHIKLEATCTCIGGDFFAQGNCSCCCFFFNNLVLFYLFLGPECLQGVAV